MVAAWKTGPEGYPGQIAPRSSLRDLGFALASRKLRRRIPRESPVEEEEKCGKDRKDERGGFGAAGSPGQPGGSMKRDVEEMARHRQSFVARIRLGEDDHVRVVRHRVESHR